MSYADLGGYRLYEPGYNVYMRGGRWVAEKQAPKTVLNPSALLNHYGRQVASGWNAGNTRSYAMVSPSGQTQFMSARHATATRQCTASTVQQLLLCQQMKTTAKIIQDQVSYYKNRLALMSSSSGSSARVAANESVTQFALGVALSNGADCKVAPNGLTVCPAPNLSMQGGTAYGEVFITNKSISKVLATPDWSQHEQSHSAQWAAFGPQRWGVRIWGRQ